MHLRAPLLRLLILLFSSSKDVCKQTAPDYRSICM